MTTIKIGAREFEVEVTRAHETAEHPEMPRYILKGKRGATYTTMRNRSMPHLMFLVHAGPRGFGIVAGYEKLGLTDANGVLEVLPGRSFV